MTRWKRWLPTRKWWAQFVGSTATVVTMAWTGDGINTDDERKAVIGVCATLVLTYIVANEKTPGGVAR